MSSETTFKILAVTFSALSAVATLVALHFGGRASAAKEADLQQFKADAETKIAGANERAAQANEQAARAAKESGEAYATTKRLELESAQQRERAATAERLLLELQQRLAPRTIPPKAEDELLTLLKPFAGQAVRIFEHVGTEEVSRLTGQIEGLLRRAGIQVSRVQAMTFGPSRSGILLRIGPSKFPMADALTAALIKAGVTTPPVAATKVAADVLELEVWPK